MHCTVIIKEALTKASPFIMLLDSEAAKGFAYVAISLISKRGNPAVMIWFMFKSSVFRTWN